LCVIIKKVVIDRKKGRNNLSVRVISGSAKRTSLKMPGGGKVRPTADRVKEALFNILGPRVVGAEILDLFAGSGALGIEALSRGGVRCVFVEKDRRVMSTLKENLRITKLLPKADLINNDVKKGLKLLARQGSSFDIIFMDPPYLQEWEIIVLEEIARLQLLKTGGVVVVESHKNQSFPDKVSWLIKVRSEKYGDTVLTFFTKTNGQKEEEELRCE